MPTTVKVYQQVLKEMQQIIKEKELEPGDRLPSERYLADKLKIGRSSVREALRAIELLGLIETKQGEGTFLRDYQSYHTVELLAGFVLQDHNTQREIMEAKKMLEKNAIELAIDKMDDAALESIELIINDDNLTHTQLHDEFFAHIFSYGQNFLLYKIWRFMQDFSKSVKNNTYGIDFYNQIAEILKTKKHHQIYTLYSEQ
ncbi:FadR/GntR family transcriptional regulator [Saliterribacillus persicus]|uniref:GntR family transcriptional regulator n=1 Tax=Saliterribacillus persicus TaxID=930114 RepID=A0A368XEA6_9BACI|nr:GntR family transcriptional regulator [Saliterribacillus persicus]RCW66311.1 GntR family transcriptional regulator [Saliterribacillus persicus]